MAIRATSRAMLRNSMKFSGVVLGVMSLQDKSMVIVPTGEPPSMSSGVVLLLLLRGPHSNCCIERPDGKDMR